MICEGVQENVEEVRHSVGAQPELSWVSEEFPRSMKTWNECISVGCGYDLLREDLLDHLDWLQKEVGFRACRFHAIFHDDIGIVKRAKNGRIYYCWSQLDKIYDALLQRRLRPFVELNPMPAALASGNQTMFDYRMNVTPPARWEEWEHLVESFASHLVERYGLAEIRQWNFEVWNEPNLPAFWSGTKDDYFRLYETSARALKRVDMQLKIGGPASSKAHWILDLISFCHKKKVPIDFISTHLYPQDEYVEAGDQAVLHVPGEFFGATFRRVKAEVAGSSLPNLNIHWTEWNPQSASDLGAVTWADNEACDNAYGGAFVVRQCLELDGACDSMSFWVASDIFMEHPMQPAPFSATYGLLTIDGIPKATANAFRLLKRLKGNIVTKINQAPRGCGGCVTQDGVAIHALFYNCQDPSEREPKHWRSRLKIPVKTQTVTVTQMRVSSEKGSAYEWWCKIGRPIHLSSAQMAAMRLAAEPECHVWTEQASDGNCTIELNLPKNSFAYFELRPKEACAPRKSEWIDVCDIEEELSQLSRK